MVTKRRTLNLIAATIRPIFLLISFILKPVYWLIIGCWQPLIQKRANDAFARDLEANLFFLVSEGQVLRNRWPSPIGFDYALVRVNYRNISFCFTQGRGELNVSLSPRDNPMDSSELGLVMTVLDGGELGDRPTIEYLSDVGDILRSRIEELDEAFSPERYPEFRMKVSLQKNAVGVLTKQAEWELNKRLYR